MVILSHVGLLSIVILVAISESAGALKVCDIKFSVSDDNRLLVEGWTPPTDLSGSEVIVRRSITLDNIKTENKAICREVERLLQVCRFPERVVNKDGTMNEDLDVTNPYILHLIDYSGLDCVPDEIRNSAVTFKVERLKKTLLFETANAMRVLIFKATEMNRIIIRDAVNKFTVVKCHGNVESPNVLELGEEIISQFRCILRFDIDNWKGDDLKAVIDKFLTERKTNLELVLHHVDGHVFEIMREDIVKIRITASERGILANIIGSVLKDCPDGIFLSIWIPKGAEHKNKLSDIFPKLQSIGKKVYKLALVDFNECLFLKVGSRDKWFCTYMPNLQKLNFSILLAEKSNQIRYISQLGVSVSKRHFPKGLDQVGIIVPEPNKHLRKWSNSFELKVGILDGVICYPNLKGITSMLINSVQYGVERIKNLPRKKLSRFAHSRECPAPRKWPFLPKKKKASPMSSPFSPFSNGRDQKLSPDDGYQELNFDGGDQKPKSDGRDQKPKSDGVDQKLNADGEDEEMAPPPYTKEA